MSETLQNKQRTTKDDFDFEEILGKGAYGQVWKVRRKLQGETFAMKILLKAKTPKQLLHRQVQILSALKHPYIIKLHEFFEDADFFYLLMQFAQGGTLLQKLKSDQYLMELEAAQVFREVLQAVSFLHKQNPPILHRDIKPENILFEGSRVLLADFGGSNYSSPARKTLCGTLEYLSPEVSKKLSHDTAADIWSMGVLLYVMMTGNLPFTAADKKQVLTNIYYKAPEFPDRFPALAKDLIVRMLSKKAEERITLEQVKAHRWLKVCVQIRPIIQQEILEQDEKQTLCTIERGKDQLQVIEEIDDESWIQYLTDDNRLQVFQLASEIEHKNKEIQTIKDRMFKDKLEMGEGELYLRRIEEKERNLQEFIEILQSRLKNKKQSLAYFQTQKLERQRIQEKIEQECRIKQKLIKHLKRDLEERSQSVPLYGTECSDILSKLSYLRSRSNNDYSFKISVTNQRINEILIQIDRMPEIYQEKRRQILHQRSVSAQQRKGSIDQENAILLRIQSINAKKAKLQHQLLNYPEVSEVLVEGLQHAYRRCNYLKEKLEQYSAHVNSYRTV